MLEVNDHETAHLWGERMNRKAFDAEKYGMVICPCCKNQGYIEYPKRQACPKCGGFGFIMEEKEEKKTEMVILIG